MEKHDENTQWVVKSSSQILGPYKTEDVFELIKKKSVIPIDEIIPENGHWSYIRDVPIFQVALNEQAQNAGVEVTKTQNVTSTFTDDMTSTELLDDTEELSHIGDIDRTNPNPKIQPIKSSQLPKPGVDEFVIAKSKTKKASSRTPLLIVLLILAVSASAYLSKDWIISQTLKFNSSQVVATAESLLAEGDLRQAYIKFQEINQLETVKATVKGFHVQFAALVLNQERQTVYARDLLEKEENALKNTPEWLTAMGLSYLIDQNYVESQKYLSQSIALNPDFLPAWVNLGHLYLNQSKFQEAWDFFYAAYLRGNTEGHIPVFMSLALIEQWRLNGDLNLLQKANDLVSNFLSTSADRRFLNQIFKIWLQLKLNSRNSNLLSGEILKFIESDPYVTSKFKQNLYEFSFESKRFESFCADIHRSLTSNELNTLLFKSVCYYKLGFIGRVTEASINQAEQLYPKETLMFAVKSVILDNADETYQKSLLIGRALSSDAKSNYILPLVLQARFCEQKNDLTCAAKYWTMVHDKNQLEIGVYAGMANYYKKKNDMQSFKKWISNGLLLSPSYKPLIELEN